ncbi:RAVE protein 1 C terminal-domain-containing protein [Zychaea mexicana]|uniref:RAVE protein 1 C terminal-domain-containing protein n=1 Tax=Zychaea mexicana TaxID=64656 RepID=UPI0022FF223D|nr:RAVE protein 1 C terminal-domain-containing protein [Zychaea mexicana]KAI9492527.1 RAVE protein 1 C terminal-domain-containing protein [Zychaea mexicana]
MPIHKEGSQPLPAWKKLWHIRPATHVAIAKFEPNSMLFATVGSADRLVTLWYTSANTTGSSELDYHFLYLSHPQYVTHIVWRRLLGPNGAPACTLFTMAKDGIGRFWRPIDLEQPHRLHMSAVIDPNQSLVTEPSSSSSTDDVNQQHHTLCNDDDDDDDNDFTPIHYISCDELKSSLYAQLRCHSKHDKLDHSLEKMRDLIRDTPDLLFRIQADGSLTFWGVQHLNVLPRRVPRVFVVLRVAQAVNPDDIPYFLNAVHVLHDYAHIQSSSSIKPAELSLVARNRRGQLRCYGLNLVDFLDTTVFAPRLYVKYSWLGHRHTIRSIKQVANNRLCTIGTDGEVNVWKYGFRETRWRPTTQLRLTSSMSFNFSKLLATTLGQDRHIAIYDGEQVAIYVLDNTGYHIQQRFACEAYDPTSTAPLSSLHFCNIPNDDEGQDNNNSSFILNNKKPAIYLLIGISTSSSCSFIWQIHMNSNNPNEIDNVTFVQSQSFGEKWKNNAAATTTHVELSGNYGTSTTSTLLASLERRSTTTTTTTEGSGTVTMTVSIDQDVLCYKLVSSKTSNEQQGTSFEWKDMYTVQTHLKDIRRIRRTANVMAIVSGSEKQHTLSLWSEIRTDVPPILQKQLSFWEPVVDIAWNVSSDGQFVLAVAFAQKISIYGEKRATQVAAEERNGSSNDWVSYVTFDVDTPDDISGIAWLDYGVLAVAAGNQLRCYLKWLTRGDHIKQQPPLDPQFEPMSNIYDESYELNGPLPFYHPNLLIHYLMWGKIDLINAVLLAVYRFLRHIIDEDDITVDHVPQICLSTLLRLQNESDGTSKKKKEQQYSSLFGEESLDETDMAIGADDEDDTRPLTRQETRYLVDQLKRRQLPGLSDHEKIHLVAMIDTFVEISTQGESLDENGARFTALLENFFHLNEALASEERKKELAPRDLIWALHSQSQDLLLERCLRLCGGKLLWEDARALGIFMWLQKSEVVTEQMTNIARNTYLNQDIKDPINCTLYYLALRKKSLLQSLWRTASHHKEQVVMVKFLANDFTESRWRTAASKNAFVLLGRQRYEYAAAFFLLADKLGDAVGVILKNLKDYQLAIAICRVYEGDHSPLLQSILHTHVLPIAKETNDRWLMSMAYSMLNDSKECIRSLVVPLTTDDDTSSDITADDNDSTAVAANVNDPNLFILYQHLKKQFRLQNKQGLEISPQVEYVFSLNVSRAYERLGCPLLALFILSKCKKPAEHIAIGNGTTTPGKDKSKKSKEMRAADLFASDNDDDDDDDNKPKESRAADLFADEECLNKKHDAADLFADEEDIFATSKPAASLSDDIFADEPDVSEKTDIFGDNDDDWLKTDNDDGLLLKDVGDENDAETGDETSMSGQQGDNAMDGLGVYKALQVLRLLQTIFHSAAALYDSTVAGELGSNHNYHASFVQTQEDILSLGESAHIPRAVMRRLLLEKSIEVDVFGLYLSIIDTADASSIVSPSDAKTFMAAFKTGCLQVFRAALTDQEYYYSGLAFMEHWSERVMSTYSIWSNLQQDISFAQAQKIALNAYVTMIMVTLKQRHFEKTWSFLSNFKNFLESLSAADTIQQGLNKIHQNEEKMVDMDPDDFDTFSDDTLFGYNMEEEVYRPTSDCNDRSAGSNMLEVAALNYVLSILEGYMQHAEKKLEATSELISFIWMVMLDPIAYRAHGLKDTINTQLEGDLTKRNMSREFKSLRQKKFWRSLKSLRAQERLLPFINFAPPDINVLPDDTEQPPQTLYSTPTTAHAFAVSSVCPDTVALVMKSEVQEIDLAGAQHYGAHMVRSTSYSSTGIAQEHHRHHPHHTDSYPDTEEEDDFGNHSSDAETDVSGSKQQQPLLGRQRSKSHHLPHHRGPYHGKTPNSSVAASPASLRLATDGASSKTAQTTHNLDNLHETLKRSLGISGKDGVFSGSEASRSSAGASSNGSIADMVTLKRTIQATCAEAHPYFPFYITGCEINGNGGPSVMLWQYGQEQEIASYNGCHGKVTRVHFDQVGQRFGAGDTTGGLLFWRFDSYAHSSKPYYSIPSCHSKSTRDFTYLDSSSLVASAGTSVAMSRRRDHICLWDTLLPPSKAMICSIPAHDNGAYAIAYEPKNRLLFTGGKRGEIVVSDIRQRSIMHTFSAHNSRIRSLAIDQANGTLVTGSIDGDLKIWDASTYKMKQAYDIQPRNRFLGTGFNRFPLKAYGVTQIQINDDSVYTSGPAGLVCWSANLHSNDQNSAGTLQ